MTLQDILAVIIPIFALLGWIYSRIDKKFKQLEMKNEQFSDKVIAEFGEVKRSLHALDIRLTRLEGRFDERGYWESRMTGTHDEK